MAARVWASLSLQLTHVAAVVRSSQSQRHHPLDGLTADEFHRGGRHPRIGRSDIEYNEIPPNLA